MAQKISVTFACDYDSREIPEGEHMTRAFSLDGRDYEIDLCEKHSQKFDEVLQRFADKARKVFSAVAVQAASSARGWGGTKSARLALASFTSVASAL